MALQITKISNPLTLIAVFASLAEIVATAVLPILDGPVQFVFVWFVIFFPVLLVALFFGTLNFNNRVLYAPSDFADEANFVRTLVGGDALVETYSAQTSANVALRDYWKPDGQIDREHEARLRAWMKDNGLADTAITAFLFGSEFAKLRRKAVADLLP